MPDIPDMALVLTGDAPWVPFEPSDSTLSLLVDRPPKVPGRIAAKAASLKKSKGMVLNGATLDKPERTVCNGAVVPLQQATFQAAKLNRDGALWGLRHGSCKGRMI